MRLRYAALIAGYLVGVVAPVDLPGAWSVCLAHGQSAWRMVSRVHIAGMVPGLEIAGRDWLSGRTLVGRRWDHTLCAMLNDLRGRERHTPRAMPR